MQDFNNAYVDHYTRSYLFYENENIYLIVKV